MCNVNVYDTNGTKKVKLKETKVDALQNSYEQGTSKNFECSKIDTHPQCPLLYIWIFFSISFVFQVNTFVANFHDAVS